MIGFVESIGSVGLGKALPLSSWVPSRSAASGVLRHLPDPTDTIGGYAGHGGGVLGAVEEAGGYAQTPSAFASPVFPGLLQQRQRRTQDIVREWHHPRESQALPVFVDHDFFFPRSTEFILTPYELQGVFPNSSPSGRRVYRHSDDTSFCRIRAINHVAAAMQKFVSALARRLSSCFFRVLSGVVK